MRAIRLCFKILYLWYWLIPTQLGVLAFICYFGLIYLSFGTIDPAEIKVILRENEIAFFVCYFLPFAVPIFISLGATFGGTAGSKNDSLENAISYRNGQMNVKPDKEASEILKRTNYLDLLSSNDSEVFQSAKRGFDAKYGASSPTKVFKDLMGED